MIVEMNELECMDFLIVQRFLGTLMKHPDTNKADLVDQILAHREMARLEALSNEYEN
jgi:hypothetical protein